MQHDFAGRTAIITGGTSGIGRGIVGLLSSRGANVVFTGTDLERGAAVAEATGARFLAYDARKTDKPDALLAFVREHSDRVDVLVNNAGGLGSPQGVEATTVEALEDTLAVHLRAPWLLMSKVAPIMRQQGGGCMVNMASVAGHRVGASSVAYSVAKAALIHLTRCAAAEFGADGIRVNSVSPGFVATGIHASAIAGGPERGERFVQGLGRLFLSRQALPHTGEALDIAETVAFLCSDAAAFITGADIVADGGLMWGRAGLM